jgi:hypothetical protein
MRTAQTLRLPTLGFGCGFLLVAAGLLAWSGSTLLPRSSAPPVIDAARSMVSLATPRITNDGQPAPLTVTLRDARGRPLRDLAVRVVPSVNYLTAHAGRTDAEGRFTASLSVRRNAMHQQTSSGVIVVRVFAGAGQQLLRQTPQLAVYNRVAVLLQGLGTAARCPANACLPSMYAPLTESVLQPLGYSAAGSAPTILQYSYRGGTMAAGPRWRWQPAAYEPCDTVQPVSRSAGMLRGMLLAYRARYPYTTFELVGHSLGGLVALQALGDERFLAQLGSWGIDKLITIDAPLNGITEFDAQTWVVDLFAGLTHLLGCSSQHFGVDMLSELSDLGDHAPTRQHLWAATARAAGVAVLDMTNRQDILVPAAYAAIDAGLPTSVVDRFLVDDDTAQTLGHGDLLYPNWGGAQTNPLWGRFAALLRAYLAQPCLAFASPARHCRYPSINVTQ